MQNIILGIQEEYNVYTQHSYTKIGKSCHYIIGTVKNNTNKDYNHVRIVFGVYDSNGVQVKKVSKYIWYLKAKGIWDFRILAPGYTNNFKLIELTGY